MGKRPWERVEGEGEIAYERFWTYLSLPRPRPTIVEFSKRINRSRGGVARMSAKFDWPGRIQAWDDAAKDVEADAILTEREKITREHLQALRAARVLGTIAIQDHLKKARGGKLSVNVREALALLRDSVQLERLILGEATERVETRELDVDVSKLTGEEAEQLLAILAKMEAE